jgi:hypothetical protein
LPEGRKEYARKLNSLRKNHFDEQGQPYYSKLLECTSFIDKFTMASRTKSLIANVLTLGNSSICNMAERLRNEIAHIGLEEQSSEILPKHKLWSFIEWAESLESQLNYYYEQQRKPNWIPPMGQKVILEGPRRDRLSDQSIRCRLKRTGCKK